MTITSTEHIFMALAAPSAPHATRDLLANSGVDYNAIVQALASIRGSQHATSLDPKSQYEALRKYGRELTEAVRRRPYSVVLFDEIEKAHPEVFNVLFQVLDDGRFTDGHGRTVDFRTTVFIMTSNVGSQYILDALDKEHLQEVIEIQLGRLRSLLAGREISVELTDAAKEFIIEQGYDPAYGARPLRRSFQRRIQDPLALQILQGDVREGDHVVVDRNGDQLIFSNNQHAT